MAHTVTLSDGTTTANLYSLSATFITSDGWQMAGGGGEPQVGDVLNLLIQGANGAAIQSSVATIERLIDNARRRAETGVGPRVWLTVQLDGEASSWRSEVLDGKLEIPQGMDQWGRLKVEASLAITRLNFWEGAETELQLSANGQAAATGGREIINTSVAWVEIAAAQVTGSLPSPVRLEMENTSGSARVYSEIHMAGNADHDPANFDFFHEGEDGSGGVSTANASSSGGNVRTMTVNTSTTLTITMTTAMMQDAKGAPFVVLARFQSITAGGVTVRAELLSLGVTVWRANEARGFERTTSQLAVLGVVPLPPNGWEATPNASLSLVLNFESEASRTVLVDYVVFLPANNYRLLTMMGASVADGGTVIDNAIDQWAGVEVSSVVYPVVSPRGNPIMLRPNTLQRIYIFSQTTTDSAVTDSFDVRAWYRPRRLTI